MEIELSPDHGEALHKEQRTAFFKEITNLLNTAMEYFYWTSKAFVWST